MPSKASDCEAGWRWLAVGEEIKVGDQFMLGSDACTVKSYEAGGAVAPAWRECYRRRVTAPTLELTADTARRLKDRAVLMEKNVVLLEEIDTLRQQQHHIGLENERLRSEVERLRLRPYEREAIEAVVDENASRGWGVLVLRKLLHRLGGGE